MRLDDIVGKKIAVRCNTEEKAKRFVDACNKSGLLELIMNKTHFDILGSETVYCIKKIKCKKHAYFENEYEYFYKMGVLIVHITSDSSYQIIELEDLDEFCQIKSIDDLKDGDIVELKNGYRLIVFKERLMGINWCEIIDRKYSNDFIRIDRTFSCYDIVKVTRNEKIVYKREEKSQAQIEKEAIEKEMRELVAKQEKLANRLNKLGV